MSTNYRQLEQAAIRLRKQFPIGTRIELISMGDDPRPIEAGTRGTVRGVDDMASVMVDWDNGRGLSLVYGEDSFRALTMEELQAEKEAKEQALAEQYIHKVNKEVIPCIEWVGMRNAYKKQDMSVPTDLLKMLHEKFLEVYPEVLTSNMGFVVVPGVAQAADGNIYPALLDLDTESSGEHWGTTFFTPQGVLDDTCEDASVRETIRGFIPYRYWYTPCLECDHHVDWDDMPEQVERMLSEATGVDYSLMGDLIN